MGKDKVGGPSPDLLPPSPSAREMVGWIERDIRAGRTPEPPITLDYALEFTEKVDLKRHGYQSVSDVYVAAEHLAHLSRVNGGIVGFRRPRPTDLTLHPLNTAIDLVRKCGKVRFRNGTHAEIDWFSGYPDSVFAKYSVTYVRPATTEDNLLRGRTITASRFADLARPYLLSGDPKSYMIRSVGRPRDMRNAWLRLAKLYLPPLVGRQLDLLMRPKKDVPRRAGGFPILRDFGSYAELSRTVYVGVDVMADGAWMLYFGYPWNVWALDSPLQLATRKMDGAEFVGVPHYEGSRGEDGRVTVEWRFRHPNAEFPHDVWPLVTTLFHGIHTEAQRMPVDQGVDDLPNVDGAGAAPGSPAETASGPEEASTPDGATDELAEGTVSGATPVRTSSMN